MLPIIQSIVLPVPEVAVSESREVPAYGNVVDLQFGNDRGAVYLRGLDKVADGRTVIFALLRNGDEEIAHDLNAPWSQRTWADLDRNGEFDEEPYVGYTIGSRDTTPRISGLSYGDAVIVYVVEEGMVMRRMAFPVLDPLLRP